MVGPEVSPAGGGGAGSRPGVSLAWIAARRRGAAGGSFYASRSGSKLARCVPFLAYGIHRP